MEMHRFSGDMLFSTMNNTAMDFSKLKTALSNVQSRLKIKKVYSLAKDNKVKSLEDLVIKIGYDPSDVKVAEDIIRNKNISIALFRKQLKIPSIEPPQNKEIGENEKHKEEIIKLIIEKNV